MQGYREAGQTLAEALAEATALLVGQTSTPRLDAELLLAHTLGWSRTRVLAERSHRLRPTELETYATLIDRRANLEPVAYITGHKEFYGLDFLVTADTLVPRPETELLVDLALAWAKQQARPLRVADIGTGTGCIAVAFAAHVVQASVIAVDRSAAALAVAASNIERHGLAGRVQWQQGDLLIGVTEPLDLLLSNPPYTILREIDENVRRHEPHLALDGGPDGLDIYRRLLAQAPEHMLPGGVILLEIGDTQAASVVALAQKSFPSATVTMHRDLAGLDRIVMIAMR